MQCSCDRLFQSKTFKIQVGSKEMFQRLKFWDDAVHHLQMHSRHLHIWRLRTRPWGFLLVPCTWYPRARPVPISVHQLGMICLFNLPQQRDVEVYHMLHNSFISSVLSWSPTRSIKLPPAFNAEGFDGARALPSGVFTEACKGSP